LLRQWLYAVCTVGKPFKLMNFRCRIAVWTVSRKLQHFHLHIASDVFISL